MESPAFELPSLLQSLLAVGRWLPRIGREAMSQHLHPLIPPGRVRLFAVEESKIYLQSPPFATVAEEAGAPLESFGRNFMLDEISPMHLLIIGDFDRVLDAPIILDYRNDGANPPVLRLSWSETAPGKPKTCWVKGANSFDEFADMLGLRSKLEENC